MLDVQNHDGLLAFLLGMIFLVLSGVGLSLIADRVTDSGVARSEIRIQLGQQEGEIQELRLALKIKHSELRESKSSRAEDLEKARLVELSEEAVQSRYENLSRLKTSLTASVSGTQESFQDYRIKAREMAWARAIGDSLGNLTTRDGRMFQEAFVVGVYDKGISIRHSTGTSSIPATALAEAYWEKFQWERPDWMPLQTITADPAVLQKAPGSSSPRKDRNNTLMEEKDIAALRAVLKRAGENATQLAHELRGISDMEASSNSSSVPGSLDTWMERKAQLSSDLANAKMQYAKARVNLMIRSPNDPQLKQERIPWGF